MTPKPTIIATSVLALFASFSYAQSRDANLEPACADPGAGMDPRCVGDTTPGTISDSTTAERERLMQQHEFAPAHR
jgi:hypothetical protein